MYIIDDRNFYIENNANKRDREYTKQVYTKNWFSNNTKNSLDKSLVSLLGVHDISTCSVTVTGVADGAGGSGAKSKNPICMPRRLQF